MDGWTDGQTVDRTPTKTKLSQRTTSVRVRWRLRFYLQLGFALTPVHNLLSFYRITPEPRFVRYRDIPRSYWAVETNQTPRRESPRAPHTHPRSGVRESAYQTHSTRDTRTYNRELTNRRQFGSNAQTVVSCRTCTMLERDRTVRRPGAEWASAKA